MIYCANNERSTFQLEIQQQQIVAFFKQKTHHLLLLPIKFNRCSITIYEIFELKIGNHTLLEMFENLQNFYFTKIT